MRYNSTKKSWRATPSETPQAATASTNKSGMASAPETTPDAGPMLPTNITVAQVSEIQRQMENTFRSLLAQLE